MARFVNIKKLEDKEDKSNEKENTIRDIETIINCENEENNKRFGIGDIKKVVRKNNEDKSISKKKTRKELKEERRVKKEIERDLKKEVKKVQKKIPDISPLLDIEENDSIKVKSGYVDLFQISSYDISSMNLYEAKNGILAFTKLLKMYKDNIKIIAMNFPTNTQVQKNFIKRKLSNCNNKIRVDELEKEYKKLEAIEKLRSDREYFCMIFAKDQQDYNNKVDLVLRVSKNLGIKTIDREKKLRILYKLNNMNSKVN